LTTSWSGSGRLAPVWVKASRGGSWKTIRNSVCVAGMSLPVRMKKGTPDHRQLSISRRNAAYVSVVESEAHPSIAR
jgi:hypothetical protein